MAGPSPAIPRPLHAHRILLDQPGRTLVRPAHRQTHPPRRPHLGPRTGERHPGLDRHLEREPATVHLDQDSRRDPRLAGRLPREDQTAWATPNWAQTISHHFWRMTLVLRVGGLLTVGLGEDFVR